MATKNNFTEQQLLTEILPVLNDKRTSESVKNMMMSQLTSSQKKLVEENLGKFRVGPHVNKDGTIAESGMDIFSPTGGTLIFLKHRQIDKIEEIYQAVQTYKASLIR